MQQNKELANYYKAIEKKIHTSKSIKKKILHSLESDIADFIEEYPEKSVTDVINHFGEPADFAKESLSILDETEIQNEVRKSKWIKRGILIVVAAIVLIAAIVAVCIIIDNSQTAVYYYSDGVIE